MDDADAEWVKKLLSRRSRTPEFHRLCRQTISALDASNLSEWAVDLLAIALIESTARPFVARAAERVLQFAATALHLNWRPTAGPFQLRSAPWRTGEAAVVAVTLLVGKGCSLSSETDEIARAWHGSSKRQPGARLGYGSAFRLSRDLVMKLDGVPATRRFFT